MDQVHEVVGKLEGENQKGFGLKENPLLFSVRSGAKFSMPGMMDTILNLGLNDETCDGLAAKSGNPRFAKDSYRRLIQTFGDVALGIELGLFEQELFKVRGDRQDYEITAEELDGLIAKYKAIVKQEAGFDFPQDPYVQLKLATEAVSAAGWPCSSRFSMAEMWASMTAS